MLQCDAWAYLGGLHDNTLVSELNYPCASSLLPCCPPFQHTAKTSRFTLHRAALFYFFHFPTNTFRTSTSKMLQYSPWSRTRSVLHVRVEVYYSALVRWSPHTGKLVYQTFQFMFKLKRPSLFVTEGSFRPWILLLCSSMSSALKVKMSLFEGC